MRLRLSLLLGSCLALGGCLEPVDAGRPTLSRCSGDCPWGSCDQRCAELLDAGEGNSPDHALELYSCRNSETPSACTAYSAERFPDDLSSPCPGGGERAYCVTLAGSGRRVAVRCSGEGARTTECPVPPSGCDGGTLVPGDPIPAPLGCEPCGVRKMYCLR